MFHNSLYKSGYNQLRYLKWFFPKITNIFEKRGTENLDLREEPFEDIAPDEMLPTGNSSIGSFLMNKNVVYVGGLNNVNLHCCKNLIVAGVKRLCILEVASKHHVLQDVSILQNGSRTEPICLDMNDSQAAIETAVKNAYERMGSIDVLINGIDMVNEQIPRLCIQNNLLGTIYSTLAAAPLMSQENGAAGRLIVNISSMFGLQPAACLAVYSATKHGIIGFSQACAEESCRRRNGIHHMTICIGLTESEMFQRLESISTFEHSKPINDEIRSLQRQSVEKCAEHMITAIQTNENGSVWMINCGQLERVETPIYWNEDYEESSLKETFGKPLQEELVHSS